MIHEKTDTSFSIPKKVRIKTKYHQNRNTYFRVEFLSPVDYTPLCRAVG
jgi:hypothetical protein